MYVQRPGKALEMYDITNGDAQQLLQWRSHTASVYSVLLLLLLLYEYEYVRHEFFCFLQFSKFP